MRTWRSARARKPGPSSAGRWPRPGGACGHHVLHLLGCEEVEQLVARRVEAPGDGDEHPRVEGRRQLAVVAQGGAQGRAVEDDGLHGLDGDRRSR